MLGYAYMNKRIGFRCAFLAVLGAVWIYGLSNGAMAQTTTSTDIGFDPNYVLTDDDVFDVSAMSQGNLKNFLRAKGTLADLKVKDIDGEEKTAADVIWRVANSYKLNPKYILAVLQKEQSLVEDSEPSQKQLDWAAGYAVCDSCSMSDPKIQAYKGFANQLEYMAKQHREKYFIQLLSIGTTIGGKSVGKAIRIDGQEVVPQNYATAMLYTYTPHIHGNLNLWRIWRRWFSFVYPNGTVVRGTPSGKIYLIRLGEKREFASKAVVESMVDEKKIIEASDTDLSSYPDGDSVKFPKYSLLRTPNGSIYLLVSDGKRKFSNMKAFDKFGFMQDDILEVEESDVSEIPDLDPITEKTVFPQGALVKSTKSNTVWYVEASVKHAIPDMAFIKIYFHGRPIRTVTQAKIDSYETGEVYRLQDGELVRGKSSPAVYVVEDGQLRAIPSAEIFETLGWKWQNVVTFPDRVIATYEIGPNFNLSSPAVETDQLATR